MTAIPDNHPLLLPNLMTKDQQQWLNGTVSVVDGYGSKGPKPRPFNYRAAVKQFQSWVYRAAMLNAMAFASVPLRLYVRKRERQTKTQEVPARRKRYLMGQGEHKPSKTVLRKVAELGSDFVEVTEPHPALQVLSAANSWQNGFELSTLRALYWQVTGNAYMHPSIGPIGVPDELFLMPSQWVEIIPSKTDFISGYIYGRKPDQVTFDADEVIHWKLPNMADVFYGMGWVEALWTALGLHSSKRVMDTAKFDNMARPDWLLVIKSGAGKEALDRLETAVESKLKGSKNSGRVLTVTGDVSAVPLNFDVQDIGDPDKVIEEIAAVSGVPLNKLRGNDPVKANSETQDVGWLRDTIMPYCRMDEEQLNARYLPLFDVGDDAVLAYDNPVAENRQLEADLAVKECGGAYKTVNEVREDDGLEPIDGGDTLRQPVNPSAGQQLGDGQNKPSDNLKKKNLVNTTRDGLARPLPDGSGIYAVCRKIFKAQHNAIMRQLGTKAMKADPPTLPEKFVAMSQWNEQLANESQPVIEIIIRQQGRRILTRVGASPEVFNVFEKNIPKAAQEQAMKFAQSTNETTSMELDDALSKLRAEIAEGLIQGDTRVELIGRVQDVFDKADSARATVIAQTEASRATHSGELMGARDSGVVSRKFWLASADACPICLDIIDEFSEGLPLDGLFMNDGGDYGDVEGPPAHPNCQCSLTYSTKDAE